MNAAYRDAYSRINALAIVGEGLADSHFRLLAGLLPEDRDDLLPLAQRLFAPRMPCSAKPCARRIGSAPW